ncbi:MAG: hypothetical protein V4683_13385 [Bacteroidota bacterium]
MKKIITLLFFIACQYAHSQGLGVGPNPPHTSAELDVNSTIRGFLMPRMINTQRTAIASPSVGLMVYQTNTSLMPASTAGLYINDASGWKRIATADEIMGGGGSSSWTVSGVNQYSNLTGNVGIGTNTPSEKLHLVGYAQVDGNIFVNNANQGVLFKEDNITKGRINLQGANDDFEMGTVTGNTTGKLVLETKFTPRLVILPDGNVGIGTISPNVNYKLDVRGNIRNEGDINIEDGFLKLSNTTDAVNWTMQYSTSTDRLLFLHQGQERITFQNGGNVGIGTVSPIDKLEVYDGNITQNNTNGTFRLQANSIDKGFMQLSGDNVRIGTYSTNDLGNLIFRVNGGDRMTISPSGNTSIAGNASVTGTTTLNGKLTVNEGFEAIHVEGNDPAINFFEAADQRGYIWMIDDNMNIGTSNANSRINMVTSQVTIGTSIATPSTYKLGVGGRIICEELKVKLQSAGWPDYVFAKNYKLKPLEEVENFIKLNNHLPNIPSAQVIDKEGLEVGEMQRRMMEKIEELTLYIIDLKKEIDGMKESSKGIKR